MIALQAGLDAVLVGVEIPGIVRVRRPRSLRGPQAHDLFTRVIDELAVEPTLPDDPTAARWELVRWWCQLIVDGQIPHKVGGRLIWNEGWGELTTPERCNCSSAGPANGGLDR